MTDKFSHFIVAQQPVYDRVVAELKAGRKSNKLSEVSEGSKAELKEASMC